ncbi:Aste57867_2221 [Aphanomyces stellatus]|uniref:Aste57867_2221 protein n=1 Tax=Aphanomyces stellatus TaxID=120398 RepID=A0A485KAT9_9STRA|nr:hypothetical protein As57867_002216 [Aphanomyces stellatus]VFT79424.1 Aste57867_2221 [Aphanomyces stellatus]
MSADASECIHKKGAIRVLFDEKTPENGSRIFSVCVTTEGLSAGVIATLAAVSVAIIGLAGYVLNARQNRKTAPSTAPRLSPSGSVLGSNKVYILLLAEMTLFQ